MNEPAEQMWLQYTHLDKLYGYLPGIPEALPAVFGLTPDEYADITARFDAHARAAAVELLADHSFAADVDALPFRPNQTVLAVGDSVTDDAQSWVEILRHVLDIRRPTDGVHIINGGLSAHTTAMVLRRWPATLAATRPDWIICALGGNDVTRIGPEPTKPQVTPAESIANLAELRRIAHTEANATWTWMSPVPVREDRIAEFPAFRYGQSTWHNSDILALADALHEFTDPVVDLVAAFGTPADSQLHGRRRPPPDHRRAEHDHASPGRPPQHRWQHPNRPPPGINTMIQPIVATVALTVASFAMTTPASVGIYQALFVFPEYFSAPQPPSATSRP